MTGVVVVDYGVVNLKNILRGLEHVGAKAESSIDPDRVIRSDRVILPGVGAFAAGMGELQKLGMDEALKSVANAGRPVLGICLGMQMLLDTSTEHGQHRGLGLIPGAVVPIPSGSTGAGGKLRKVPHIGWNALCYPSHLSNWYGSCLDDTSPGSYCYFSHSYMVEPEIAVHVLAECVYEELSVIGAIRNENITGLQFHPERSGSVGLEILRRFFNQ
jgi:glutamine amidotransferase